MEKYLIKYKNTDTVNSFQSIVNLSNDKIIDCNSKLFEVNSNDYSELKGMEVKDRTMKLIFNNVTFKFLDEDDVLITIGKKKMVIKIESIIDKIRFLNHLSYFSEKFNITEVLSVWDSDCIEMLIYIINKELSKVEHVDGDWYFNTKRNIGEYIKKSITKPLLSSKTPTSKEVDDYISQKEKYENMIRIFKITEKTPIYKFINILDSIIKPIVDKYFESYLESDKKEKMDYLEDNLMDGLDIKKVYDGYSHYDISAFKYQIIELNNNFEDVKIYIK